MWIVIGIAIVLLFVFYVGKYFNTYVLIARNTTYIYEILSTDFEDRFPNEDVLLATSGAIDALKYVMEDAKESVRSRGQHLPPFFARTRRHNSIHSFGTDCQSLATRFM